MAVKLYSVSMDTSFSTGNIAGSSSSVLSLITTGWLSLFNTVPGAIIVLEKEVTILVREYPSRTAFAMGWSGNSVTTRLSWSSLSVKVNNQIVETDALTLQVQCTCA